MPFFKPGIEEVAISDLDKRRILTAIQTPDEGESRFAFLRIQSFSSI